VVATRHMCGDGGGDGLARTEPAGTVPAEGGTSASTGRCSAGTGGPEAYSTIRSRRGCRPAGQAESGAEPHLYRPLSPVRRLHHHPWRRRDPVAALTMQPRREPGPSRTVRGRESVEEGGRANRPVVASQLTLRPPAVPADISTLTSPSAGTVPPAALAVVRLVRHHHLCHGRGRGPAAACGCGRRQRPAARAAVTRATAPRPPVGPLAAARGLAPVDPPVPPVSEPSGRPSVRRARGGTPRLTGFSPPLHLG